MVDMDKMKQEWLETDGLGGFACGTVSGIRSRRYHALLVAATNPPAGRVVLVNGFDATVKTAAGNYALSSQLYTPDVIHPDGAQRITGFTTEPWPQWTYALEDGTRIQQELFVLGGAPIVCLSWKLIAQREAILSVRPFLSGRDYHALHHENGAFNFMPEKERERLLWRAYYGIPAIITIHNGKYSHQPDWYRGFVYEEERARGLDFTEDLASPGIFTWDLARAEAVWILGAEGFVDDSLAPDLSAKQLLENLRARETRHRALFPSALDRAADAYLVRRGKGKTIVAGYPWFTDWGRDSFISLRGLALATDRLQDARDILLEWSSVVSDGMLPNRFPDRGDAPEYNSVDASLWYVVAVHDFLTTAKKRGFPVNDSQKKSLEKAIEAILTGYSQGTRYGIHQDADGLLAAGVQGMQLTWMDVKIGDWVVTPRIGKPVEVQALWLNALWIGSKFSMRWKEHFTRGWESFHSRFWQEQGGHLWDVVDADHEPGKRDGSFRPNQIFAVGGLPLQIIEGERARAVVDAVEQRLWTPLGLRSLAPGEQGYTPHYAGAVRERDSAYHQGTVWPWLMGPFVEAWVRVRGNSPQAAREARARFLKPLFEHLDSVGLGHVSEIADADPPHTPRGCPFQAWSLAELIRLDRMVLGAKFGSGELTDCRQNPLPPGEGKGEGQQGAATECSRDAARP
jgi:predicted glycogen debranching enzyme